MMDKGGAEPCNPPIGDGMLPIGCVANSRILDMPAAYAVSATSDYPSIDSFFLDGEQTIVGGPYTYGSKLVVTTDFGTASRMQSTYFEARTQSNRPMASKVSVSVCVEQGSTR